MRKIICALSLIIFCGLFIGCSSNAPVDDSSAENYQDETVNDVESERIEHTYKLSEEIDLNNIELDADIAENPWGYDIYLVIPGDILKMEVVDTIEQITNVKQDSKGNCEITTTTTHDTVIYTDAEGQEELRNYYHGRFVDAINEISRDDSLGIHISYNDDFSEFEITGPQDAIENMPDIYITSMMQLGAFYQAIQGKSMDEIEVTVTVYYFS